MALATGYSKLGRAEDSRRERRLSISMAREGEANAGR
jgi:hypothetical protein